MTTNRTRSMQSTRRALVRTAALAAPALGALGGLGLAACGAQPGPAPAAAPAGPPVELSWWMSEDPVASGMQEVADAYNAAQPAIKVAITPQTSGYEDKLRAALAAGTPPEVARLNDDLIASYVCRGSCRPLEDYLTRARVKKDEFFSAQWRLPTVEGKTYAIVVGYTPQVVWVNAEHFQRAGLKVPTVPYKSDEWTWADFLDAARKMTAPPGPDGISPVYGTSALQSWYGYWVWGNGGEVLTPDKKRFGLALPSGYEALQWAADLINKHKVHPPMAYIRQPGLGALDLFAAGRLGMLAGGGNWATLRQRAAALNWDIVPYPKGKVRRGHTSTPLLFMVPTGTRHPDQAFTFLMHLVSDDAQKIVGAKGFRMPPKKAQANSSLFLRPDLPPKNQRLWLDAQEGALEEPQIPQREKLRQTYRPALEPVWAGTQTAQEAMKAVEAQCNAVLAEPCA